MTVKVLGSTREAEQSILKPLTARARKERRLINFDTETLPDNGGVHTAFMVCAEFRRTRTVNGQKQWTYEKFEAVSADVGPEFAAWVEEMCPRRSGSAMRTVLNAHNAQFDFMAMGLHAEFLSRGWALDPGACIISDTSRPFRMVYTRDSELRDADGRIKWQTLIVMDNGNLWAGESVKSLGNSLNFPKGEFSFHDDERTKDFSRSRRALETDTPEREECIQYCRRDVEILRAAYEAFEDFMIENDLGAIRSTIAATAMSTFLTRFLPDDITIELHNNPDLFKLEERSYNGGCVAVRRLIQHLVENNSVQVDFFSMYASVMNTEKLPVQLAEYLPRGVVQPTPRQALGWCRKYFLIADVTLVVPDGFGNARYPKRTPDKLIFPVGRFKTTLCGPELEHALKKDLVVEIEECAYYYTAVIFKEYTTFFCDKKIEYAAAGNTIFEKLAKIFSNSLYGKFGQTTEKFIAAADGETPQSIFEEMEEFFEQNPDVVYTDLWDVNGKRYRGKRIFGEMVMVSDCTRIAAKRTIMSIAAAITSHARTRLFDAGEIAGWENVIYADTDSWIVTPEGLENLERAGMIRNEMGGLMPEMKIVKLGVYGLKMYEIIGHKYDKTTNDYREEVSHKRRHKGVSVKTDKNGNVTNLTPEGDWILDVFQKWHPAAIRGKTKGVLITEIVKTGAAPEYTKGIVGADGWVEPHRLMEVPA